MPTEKERFEELIREELLPLFPQSELSETPPRHSHIRAAYSTSHASTAVRLQPQITSGYAFLISRSQGFEPREKMVMEAFITHLAPLQVALQPYLAKRLRKTQMDLVIADAIATTAHNRPTMEIAAFLFEVLEQWAQETYEGHRISAAFGIESVASPAKDVSTMQNYLRLQPAKVVGDGCSTLVVLGTDGRVLRHEYLGPPGQSTKVFAPFAFAPMAAWATENRVAIALNRGGEILVFAQGRIIFARRRGQWIHFSHQSAVSQMATNGPRGFAADLRLAAYLSALDISFSRAGGGIGLVRRGESVVGTGLPVQARDELSGRRTEKTKALRTLLGASRYQDLPRPFRQELGAIDGAVVIQHDGAIITAGAVLAVSVSSDEGARKTAAKTLGKYGLGMKISSDGKIEAYTGEPLPDQKPLFEIG